MIELIIAAVTTSWLGAFAVTDTVKALRRRRHTTPDSSRDSGPLVYVPTSTRNRAA